MVFVILMGKITYVETKMGELESILAENDEEMSNAMLNENIL